MKFRTITLTAAIAMMAGCSAMPQQFGGQTTADKTAEASSDTGIIGTPARKSKFAKLRIGMSNTEVESLIGKPSDSKKSLTAKSVIPFINDAERLETYYKHEGRLLYSFDSVLNGNTPRLITITVDTKENGFQ